MSLLEHLTRFCHFVVFFTVCCHLWVLLLLSGCVRVCARVYM